MSANDLHDLLDRAGERAPVLDTSAIARQAQAGAVRRQRRRVVAVPAVAVVAVIVAVGTFTRLDDQQKGDPGSQPSAPVISQGTSTASPGGDSSATPADSSPAGFSCCTDADIQQPAQPGSTFLLHWIRQGKGQAAVRLEATLTGPYTSVDQLKAGAKGHATYSATPLTTSADAPVSTIAIPADALPGRYDLVFTVGAADAGTNASSGGGGGSVITITK